MRLFPIFVIFLFASCSQKFYVVRHAEKAAANADGSSGFPASDPPLSQAGTARAELLQDKLSGKKIGHIFSTKYKRNLLTAQPLAEAEKLQVQLYHPHPDSLQDFILKLQAIRKGNVLVVGHSNTVDDIVNKFTGTTHIPADLPETEYDNIFIITRKGSGWTFKREKYGDAAGVDKK